MPRSSARWIVATPSSSVALPYVPDIGMHPSPIAETDGPSDRADEPSRRPSLLTTGSIPPHHTGHLTLLAAPRVSSSGTPAVAGADADA